MNVFEFVRSACDFHCCYSVDFNFPTNKHPEFKRHSFLCRNLPSKKSSVVVFAFDNPHTFIFRHAVSQNNYESNLMAGALKFLSFYVLVSSSSITMAIRFLASCQGSNVSRV